MSIVIILENSITNKCTKQWSCIKVQFNAIFCNVKHIDAMISSSVNRTQWRASYSRNNQTTDLFQPILFSTVEKENVKHLNIRSVDYKVDEKQRQPRTVSENQSLIQ